jgi:hypothetical protein
MIPNGNGGYTDPSDPTQHSGLIVAYWLFFASWAIHLWGDVYPWLTGLTAIFAFCLGGHSMLRLLYRWVFLRKNTIKENGHVPSVAQDEETNSD